MDVLLRSLSAVRGRLAVRGPDRKRFLHGMLTNDIKGLRPGQGCHAVLLTVKAKMVADMTVYDCDDEPPAELLLELERSATERVRLDLDRHLIMDDAEIVDRSGELDELAVYGAEEPGLAQALGAVLPGPLAALAELQHQRIGDLRVAATRELGRPGYRLFAATEALAAIAARLRQAGARDLDEASAEVLRVEAGVPRYGLDMDEERLPIEANLERAVSFTKGCYLGQEPIARLSARGHVNRRLLGLRLRLGADAPLPARGTVLRHESREAAATLTTAVRSPRHGAIALGYVHRSLWEPGTQLSLPDGGTAEVTALPFA